MNLSGAKVNLLTLITVFRGRSEMKLKIKKLDAKKLEIIDKLIGGLLFIFLISMLSATVLVTSLASSNSITQTPFFVIINGIEY